MRRVIYAWNYVEWGGAQIHFLGLIKAARREFEIVVVLPKGTDPQFLELLRSSNIRYEEFEPAVDLRPTSGIFSKLSRRWRRIQSEHRMIRKVRDVGIKNAIVHIDILPTQSFLSLARLCAITNVFITSHNALPKVSRLRWKWMRMKFLAISKFKCLHVFCTNEHAASYFRRLYGKRIADQIRLTYDSIDPEEIERARNANFDRNEMLDRLRVAPDRFIVLAVGQFVDRKGRWTFLEAAKKVAAQDNSIDFIWLTPSNPSEEDRSRIVSYGLGDRFRLVSSTAIENSRNAVLQFYRLGDVFALPSFVEGLPISLLEAMAMGLPAISTNINGIPEAIRHEETGLLIEPGDTDALADAILRLKAEPELRHQLGTAGREHVLRSFDEREAARTAVSEYKRAFDPQK